MKKNLTNIATGWNFGLIYTCLILIIILWCQLAFLLKYQSFGLEQVIHVVQWLVIYVSRIAKTPSFLKVFFFFFLRGGFVSCLFFSCCLYTWLRIVRNAQLNLCACPDCEYVKLPSFWTLWASWPFIMFHEWIKRLIA